MTNAFNISTHTILLKFNIYKFIHFTQRNQLQHRPLLHFIHCSIMSAFSSFLRSFSMCLITKNHLCFLHWKWNFFEIKKIVHFLHFWVCRFIIWLEKEKTRKIVFLVFCGLLGLIKRVWLCVFFCWKIKSERLVLYFSCFP